MPEPLSVVPRKSDRLLPRRTKRQDKPDALASLDLSNPAVRHLAANWRMRIPLRLAWWFTVCWLCSSDSVWMCRQIDFGRAT